MQLAHQPILCCKNKTWMKTIYNKFKYKTPLKLYQLLYLKLALSSMLNCMFISFDGGFFVIANSVLSIIFALISLIAPIYITFKL